MRKVLTDNLPGVHPPKTNSGWETFQNLVETAERLFTASSFFDVSVSDICKAANTAVGTFYIYFDTKTDIYRYLVEYYKKRIRMALKESISTCTTRRQKEREGMKCFVKFAMENPMLYNIIWGSLSVDKQLFKDYYVSFANNYTRALTEDKEQIRADDVMSLSYALMGISSFLGLKAIFDDMTQEQIDKMIDETIIPILRGGIILQERTP